MFVDEPHPDDIQQGAVGDCYFLAVIASMAEKGDRIRELFYTKKANKAGVYMMTFYVNGKKTPVVVDDYVPVDQNGRLVMANTKSKELWPILLEKAWAKLHTTYARMEGGLPSFACIHLMGTPAESLYNADFFEAEKMD